MRNVAFSESGGVIVMCAMLLPVAVGMLLAVVMLGQLGFARAKLQSAADIAVLNGAASLAHSLNVISQKDRDIENEFNSLRADFANDSQQGEAAASERFGRYSREVGARAANISGIIENMAERAKEVAALAFLVNSSGASFNVSSVADVRMEEALRQFVGYSRIEGGSYVDPSSTEDGGFDALVRLRKIRSNAPFVTVVAKKTIKPVYGARLFGGGFDVVAAAAASAFGGDAENFAQGGDDSLYWFALTPLRRIGLEQFNN